MITEEFYRYLDACSLEGRRAKSIPATLEEIRKFDLECLEFGRVSDSRCTRREFCGVPVVERPDAKVLRQAGAYASAPIPTFERVEIPANKLGMAMRFDTAYPEFSVDQVFNHARRTAELHFRTLIYGERNQQPEAVTYPADWWQAFKERWFPAVLLELFPVRWKVVQLTFSEFYPGLKPAIPGRDVSFVLHTRSFQSRF